MGRYIALEGSEGCGKSTQAARLARALDGVLTRETGGTEVGQRIRAILHDTSVTDLSYRAEALLAAYERAGYRRVAPPILQLAEPFLDLSGEDIRKRMYLTSAPGGEELCLRPDLTIPVSRDYLASPLAGGLAPLIAAGLLKWSGGQAWPIAVYLVGMALVTGEDILQAFLLQQHLQRFGIVAKGTVALRIRTSIALIEFLAQFRGENTFRIPQRVESCPAKVCSAQLYLIFAQKGWYLRQTNRNS